MKKLTCLLLLTVLPTALSAQSAQEEPPVRKREPFVRQHELRLTAGAFPLPFCIHWDSGDPFYLFSLNRTKRGPVYTSGAWSLSYDYRIKKWFDVGLTFSYYGEYSNSHRYSYRDDSWLLTERRRFNCLTIMPLVRFTWVNTRWVRMYSTLGLGVSIGCDGLYEQYDGIHYAMPAFQFTPVGISVGRSLFGFAEVGLGAQGALMMGVGYKFKPKNKQTK